MIEQKIFMRVCMRCHKPSPAYDYLVCKGEYVYYKGEYKLNTNTYRRVCKVCIVKEQRAAQYSRYLERQKERRLVLKEVDKEHKKEMQGLNIKKRALEKVVGLINKHLQEAVIPPIAVPTFNSRKEIDQHLTSLRRIRRQYFSFTRVNRNNILRMERVLRNQGTSPDERTTTALCLRKQNQNLAAEAFKISLDEYLSGAMWTDISEQYRDLLLVVNK